MGFTYNADLVVKQQGRGFRIGTSSESQNGAYKTALWLTSWETGLPDTGGHAVFFGKAQFRAGKGDQRAPIRIWDQAESATVPANFAPAPSQLEDGDLWRIGSTLYLRVGGTTKSITFT